MTRIPLTQWNLKQVLTVVEGQSGAIIYLHPQPLHNGTPEMLDAFIIEKIQKERDPRDSGREQLHIEIQRDQVHEVRDRKDQEREERGVAIIDFNI